MENHVDDECDVVGGGVCCWCMQPPSSGYTHITCGHIQECTSSCVRPSVWCNLCCNCHYEENEDVGCSCQLYLIFVVVVIFQFFKRCHNHFLLPVMMMWRLKLYCGLVWVMWYNYRSTRIWLKPWSSRQHTDCRLRDKYAPREACN